MKQHAEFGRKIIFSSAERIEGDNFLVVAGEIAESHHEKWDGTGYPLGLAGIVIPLSGRIEHEIIEIATLFKDDAEADHSAKRFAVPARHCRLRIFRVRRLRSTPDPHANARPLPGSTVRKAKSDRDDAIADRACAGWQIRFR